MWFRSFSVLERGRRGCESTKRMKEKKSLNKKEIFLSSLWMASSKVSCWLSFLREQCGVKGAREKGKTARRSGGGVGGRRNTETGTWKTRLFLSSSQLGLWKSEKAQCEAVLCWPSTPLSFSFPLLWACGFLITVSLNRCPFPSSIFWWIEAIIAVGSGQFPSSVSSVNRTYRVCHFSSVSAGSWAKF